MRKVRAVEGKGKAMHSLGAFSSYAAFKVTVLKIRNEKILERKKIDHYTSFMWGVTIQSIAVSFSISEILLYN